MEVGEPASRSAPKSSTPAAQPPTASRLTGAAARSFPLVALFQLATFCAALAACVDGPALGKIVDQLAGESLKTAIIATVAATALGAMLGAMIGLGQFRMWRSAGIGMLVGAVGGVAILCVYVAPASLARTTGAAIVLTLATVLVRLRAD